jgi:hypothetical protein
MDMRFDVIKLICDVFTFLFIFRRNSHERTEHLGELVTMDLSTGMSRMEQIYGTVLSQSICMRMTHLTPIQLSSVPCPSCGAATGQLCELHSGGLRVEPHLDRKLAAAEAVETKRMHVVSESRRGRCVNKAVHL